MKKTILFSIIFIYSFALSAQKNPSKIWGTIAIDSVSSMYKTEVSVKDWINFLINNNYNLDYFPNPERISRLTRLLFDDLKKGKNFEYIIVGYSSGRAQRYSGEKSFIITEKFKKLIKADSFYYSINIPIVGITYRQALSYCKWKENSINEVSLIPIKVSLPTLQMYQKWIMNEDSINSKKCYMLNSLNCNCSSQKKTKITKSEGKCLLDVDRYFPDQNGFYSLQGNAAEMTDSPGIAMGGSFRDYARQSYNDKIKSYSGAEDWLGFRFYITIK